MTTSVTQEVLTTPDLADGTFLVGDAGTGTPDVSHVENEVVLSSLRWLKLQVPETVTRGSWVEKPDLSKVDEIGWAQLMPGSGHGAGAWSKRSTRRPGGRWVARVDANFALDLHLPEG